MLLRRLRLVAANVLLGSVLYASKFISALLKSITELGDLFYQTLICFHLNSNVATEEHLL